jgi:hypothetical protein
LQISAVPDRSHCFGAKLADTRIPRQKSTGLYQPEMLRPTLLPRIEESWLSTPFHKYGVESNPLAYARGSLQKNHDRQGVAHAE